LYCDAIKFENGSEWETKKKSTRKTGHKTHKPNTKRLKKKRVFLMTTPHQK